MISYQRLLLWARPAASSCRGLAPASMTLVRRVKTVPKDVDADLRRHDGTCRRKRLLVSTLGSRRSSVAMMTGLLAVPLIAMMGLALDLTRIWLVKSRLQMS